MTESSSLDTDSDSEPNTIGANVFWGHLKTPEQFRINYDPPQTVLKSNIHSYESPSRSVHGISNVADCGTINLLETADPNNQSENHGSAQLSASSSVGNVNLANVDGSNQSCLPSSSSLEVIQKNDNGYGEHALTVPSGPLITSEFPNGLERNITTTLPSVSPNEKLCQAPNPLTSLSFATPTRDESPVKLLNESPQQSVSPGTMQASDYIVRKERRMKLKHNEDSRRFPLLSLSPTSTNVLRLVQSPLRDVDNKLTMPQSPFQKKAQRILLPASLRSPIKPIGLCLPSPVKLNDPNRISARRVLNPQSPSRMVQNISLISSPARRIPVISSNARTANPDTSKQTTDIFASTSTTLPNSFTGRSNNIYSVNYPRNTATSVLITPSVMFPPKNQASTRSNNTKAGPSRLPILSTRTVPNQPINPPLAQKFDPAPAPTILISPNKPKLGDKTHIFASQSQTGELFLDLKRKRTETELEDESGRPNKRVIADTQSILHQSLDSSRAEIARVTTGSSTQDPSILTSSVMKIDKTTDPRPPVLIPGAVSVGPPAISPGLVIPSPHPRRTSRARKPTAVSLKERRLPLAQASTQRLSRTDSLPKLQTKPSSRPPSRSASRADNFEGYPDNPRQLQWLTSVNTQRNQESVVELARQVIRKVGNRPPSPSSGFRIDTKKGREEREARAERRQRRDRSDESLVANVSTCVQMTACSNPIIQQKHMRAPGDEEDYETPARTLKPSQFNSEIMAKTVKWCKDLIEIPVNSQYNPPEQQAQPKAMLKSCFSKDPTTFTLNPLGNVPNASQSLPDVVKEHVVVSQFIYDNDIHESPRRVKKKLT